MRGMCKRRLPGDGWGEIVLSNVLKLGQPQGAGKRC